MNRPAAARASTLLCCAALSSAAFGFDTLSAGQMAAAERVFTGTATCEFDQQITLAAVAAKPGHFTLTHKKASYTLVPQETTSGAVRLEDKKSGLVWIQIPAKSMLMNTKLGQRVADVCITPEQRKASVVAGG